MSKYKFCYIIEVSGNSNTPGHLQLSILQVIKDSLIMIVSIFDTKSESVNIKIGEVDSEETHIQRVKFSPIDK